MNHKVPSLRSPVPGLGHDGSLPVAEKTDHSKRTEENLVPETVDRKTV
jgi:hypothetical protein